MTPQEVMSKLKELGYENVGTGTVIKKKSNYVYTAHADEDNETIFLTCKLESANPVKIYSLVIVGEKSENYVANLLNDHNFIDRWEE